MPLNPRRQRFIEEYTAAPANAAAAARKAGFSTSRAKVTACELLKNPDVKQAIEQEQIRFRAQIEYTRENAVQDLMQIIRGNTSAATHKIAAIRELGKLYGLYPN